MHANNICHRDLKPENILLDSNEDSFNIKLTDFGFARFHDPNKEDGMNDMLGSPLYMAPEIIKKLPYDMKVDIWSLGVILYIMLTGRPPFKGRTKDEIFLSVISQPIPFGDTVWQDVSAEARMFVKKMLTRDPRFRPNCEALIKENWIQKYLDPVEVESSVLRNVGERLHNFRKFTVF